jgi:hypothetical protein
MPGVHFIESDTSLTLIAQTTVVVVNTFVVLPQGVGVIVCGSQFKHGGTSVTVVLTIVVDIILKVKS